MQKTDEKIRKAEEIYCRRNGIKYRGETVKKRSHNWNLVLVILIIMGVYLYENSTVILNENIKRQIRSFLNTPIRFESIIDIIKGKKKDNNNIANGTENKLNENNSVATPKEENGEITEESTQINTEEEVNKLEEKVYEVIWPYKGEVTSGFGERTSEDTRVTANHTGIDVAGNER